MKIYFERESKLEYEARKFTSLCRGFSE